MGPATSSILIGNNRPIINQNNFYNETKKLRFCGESQARNVVVYKQLGVPQMHCAVCQNWAKDPVTICIPRNVHIFCRDCVKPNQVEACPICREPAKVAYKSDIIKNFESLFKQIGWQCPVGCGSVVSDSDLAFHCQTCAPINCEFCGEKGTRQWLRQHLSSCDNVSVPCDLCALPLKRGDMEAHKQSACPDTVVTKYIGLIDQAVSLKRRHSQVLQSESLVKTELGEAVRELFHQHKLSCLSVAVDLPVSVVQPEILLDEIVTFSMIDNLRVKFGDVELGYITIPAITAKITSSFGNEQRADYLIFGIRMHNWSKVDGPISMRNLAESGIGFTIEFGGESESLPGEVSPVSPPDLGEDELKSREYNKREHTVSVYGSSADEEELLLQLPFSLHSVETMVNKYNYQFMNKLEHEYNKFTMKEAVFCLFFYKGFPGYEYLKKHDGNAKFRLCVEK